MGSAMQVSCNACGVASDRAGLDLVDGGFGFVCDECGTTNVLAPVPTAAQAPAAAADPPADDPPAAEPQPEPSPEIELPPGHACCPKCDNVQRDHYACHRCGLVFANVAAGKASFTSDPLHGRADAKSMREEWARLRRNLDDTDAHRRFIERCAHSNALDFAGECYRRLTPPGHAEDPRVSEYRQRVVAAAMANVDRRGQRAEAVASNLRRLLVMLVGAALLLGFAIGYFLLTRAGSALQHHG